MNRFITIFAAAVLFQSLTAADASAAEWQMLASFPGRPASGFFDIFVGDEVFFKTRMDFDGDGVPDKSFVVTGPPGEEIFIDKFIIISGADPNQKWIVSLAQSLIDDLIGWNLMGFFNFDGTVSSNDTKEILIGQKVDNWYINPIIINAGAGDDMIEVQSFGANAVFVAAGDVNGDGRADIIVFDPGAKEVQVWGYQ